MSHLRPQAPVGSKARIIDPNYYSGTGGNAGLRERSEEEIRLDFNYGGDIRVETEYNEPYRPTDSAPLDSNGTYPGRRQKARKMFASGSAATDPLGSYSPTTSFTEAFGGGSTRELRPLAAEEEPPPPKPPEPE